MTQAAWIITPEQLKEELSGAQKPRLLDVRELEEFEESRIDGCVLIPMAELEERASNELLKDEDIVIYCAHGVRSLHAVMMLRMLGFKKLRSLEGGIVAWQDYLG